MKTVRNTSLTTHLSPRATHTLFCQGTKRFDRGVAGTHRLRCRWWETIQLTSAATEPKKNIKKIGWDAIRLCSLAESALFGSNVLAFRWFRADHDHFRQFHVIIIIHSMILQESLEREFCTTTMISSLHNWWYKHIPYSDAMEMAK